MDHSIRASRPSRHGIDPEMVAEALHAKEMAIRLYQQLIERGIPLFEKPGEMPDTPAPGRPAETFPELDEPGNEAFAQPLELIGA
jgi:hypothetical protein